MFHTQKYWLAIAKDPNDLSWGGHNGYDDRVEEHYAYDSNVGNSRNIQIKDLIFVRGSDFVTGFGQIQSIQQKFGLKEIRRCPKCRHSPESRKVRTPKWRCTGCRFEFGDSEVLIEQMEVVKSIASYEGAWISAEKPMSREEVFEFQTNRDTQSAIRALDGLRIQELILKLASKGAGKDLRTTEIPNVSINGATISVIKRT